MKFSNIQVLRALAAAFVVYVHAFGTYQAKVGPIADDLSPHLGDLGVKLFFCISGFIIFNSSSRLSGGLQSSLEFFIKRCIRILPLYWAATSVYAVKLVSQGTPPSPSDYAFSLLFIPYADSTGLMRPVLGQGWTLNFEMVFYILTTVLLLFRSRLRYHALIASLVITVGINHVWLAGSEGGASSALGLITTELLLFFAGGILVGMVTPKLAAYVSSLSIVSLLRLPLALTAVGVAVIGLESTRGTTMLTALFWLEWSCCTVAVFAASIPEQAESSLGRVFLQPAINAGDGSYSTYLLHGFLMGPAARALSLFHVDLSVQWFAIVMVVLCTIAGFYSFRYFEQPVQRVLLDLWKQRLRTRAVAVG